VSWLAILCLREMAEIIRLRAERRGRIGPRLSLFSIVFVSTFMLALVVAWYVASDATTTVATKITPNTIQVVDGDTIRTGSLVYRLVGFDTPETYQAKCPQERALGERATARLRMIVSRSALELTEVRCSCPPETQGTQSCNYGRRCGLLKANGEDVAQILIREGLARPYVCGSYGCPKRKPWC
jgi:endonuclease YncB( thermonuclease family)